MIKNVDPQLSQWDVGRVVTVIDTDATHVHFANQGDSKAVVVEIKNGTAEIPDFLLQTGKTMIAYCVLHKSDTNRVTLESKSFSVRKRERPEDYVYEKSKRDYIYELITDAQVATEAANQATQNANEAADKANQAAKSWVIIGEVKGESMVIDDAIDQTFAGFRIFGKTTQDGVPTPEAPVDLVSVENPTVEVNEQSMLVPYTLRGIPVTSGGNYIDSNGQRWLCDEVDFDRGVYLKRIATITSSQIATVGSLGIHDNGIPFISLWVDGATSKIAPMSTRYAGGFSSTLNGRCYCTTNGLVVNDMRFSDLSVAQAIMRSENSVFLFPISTPIETHLSEEELAAYAALHTSRYGTTVSNDRNAYMDIHYHMDAKKYIDSLVGSSAGLVNATVE